MIDIDQDFLYSNIDESLNVTLCTTIVCPFSFSLSIKEKKRKSKNENESTKDNTLGFII